MGGITMANLNNASKKIEDLFLEEVKESAETKPAEALNNYLELAADMSMPVLKINDLLSDKQEKTVEREEFNLNQPMKDEPVIEEPKIQKPNESIKAGARRIADAIQDEARKFWTSKRFIRNKINEINSRNAYSFAGYMITTSDTGTVIGDIKKYITCSEVKHLVFCLLKQAKECGLVNIAQYSKLKRAHMNITKIWNSNPNKKLDNKTFSQMNQALEDMFEELSKIY